MSKQNQSQYRATQMTITLAALVAEVRDSFGHDKASQLFRRAIDKAKKEQTVK